MTAAAAALCHAATVAIAAPAETIFRFMADGAMLGTWAMGCWNTRQIAPGLFAGHSLFDGSQGLVRIVAQPALLNVDYLVGADPDALAHQNSARILPGSALGHSPEHCVLTLLAWRAAQHDDTIWHRLCTTHEAEVLLIQAWFANGRLRHPQQEPAS